ncbi:unnamed protein product [Brassicogethes aeneus]|uniref:Uncharacterized protein n=1 Tax=Brassicogethes aeneus TaxID=1431903 RepID=A0A9P0FND0_BRAAE|nr:unnamed protein product [Brassicogethes aeneus]
MVPIYILGIFIINAKAQIEDIPIENYERLKHGDNDMDMELLPRLQREDDPKGHFFRYMKSLNSEFQPNDDSVSERFRNIPRPGGFRLLEEQRRLKRGAEDTTTITTTVLPDSILSEVIKKHLGKPLEISELETTTTRNVKGLDSEHSTLSNNLLINDFIRFKREAKSDTNPTITNSDADSDSSRLKREHKSGDAENKNFEDRTKEQWTKQLYPVRRSDNYEDNTQVSSETVRAPRVHFVTQRRLESNVPKTYEREARSRDLSTDKTRDMDYYQPRYSRHYSPPITPHSYRNDPYYSRYDSQNDYYDRYDNHYADRDRSYNAKPKRIIYYATLPDITRTPPNVDLRDRYNYGDRYENRYYPSLDRYRSTKRYDSYDRSKDTYPLKVSTDVNVKEIQKNPERRIYSEVDRRYPPY